jgi:hypothetical protein
MRILERHIWNVIVISLALCAAWTSAEAYEVWATGNNSFGQLGLGDSESRLKFVRIQSFYDEVLEVACGASHTIFRTEDSDFVRVMKYRLPGVSHAKIRITGSILALMQGSRTARPSRMHWMALP